MFCQFTSLSIRVSFFIITFFGILCPAPQAFATNEVVHNGITYGITSNAQLYGGPLVTISDATLNEWLRSTFAGYGNYFQIGLHYNTTFGTPETDTTNWRWYGTGTNSPAYRNFASGYPRTGVAGSTDYALMRTSDGKWIDYYPSQSGIYTSYGIYEAPASVVPITMNCSVHCYANTGMSADDHNGINTTSASAFSSGMDPTGQYMIFYSADSNISCTGGAWGGRIESITSTSPGDGLQPVYSVAETTGTSTVTIGSSASYPDGSPLMLHVDPNGAINYFSLLRGTNSLLSITNNQTETDLLVYAGETLNVHYSNSMYGYSPLNSGAVNMWLFAVPEPGSSLLIITAGIFITAWKLVRKKSIVQQ